MKYINLAIKFPNVGTLESKVESTPRLVRFLEGRAVEMLSLQTHFLSQQDVQEVIDFLTQVKHCFPKPPKE